MHAPVSSILCPVAGPLWLSQGKCGGAEFASSRVHATLAYK